MLQVKDLANEKNAYNFSLTVWPWTINLGMLILPKRTGNTTQRFANVDFVLFLLNIFVENRHPLISFKNVKM